MRSVRALALGLLAAGLTAGCGGNGGVGVEGTVSYNGEPVKSGTISFVPEEGAGGKLAGGPIVDGAYKVEPEFGPRPGKHRVEISWRKATGKTVVAVPLAEGRSGEGSEAGVVKGKVAEIVEGIPPKYNTASELTADLTSGTNKLDYPLTGPPTAIPLTGAPAAAAKTAGP